MRFRISLLATLLMSCMAWGAATPWNGSTVAPTLSGSTYTIATAEELAWIAAQSQTEDFAGKTIRLTADLDLGGALETPTKWKPIGSTSMPFRGEIDGNNHVIYNLYIFSSSINSAGLIAETASEANIHNLGLAQGKIMTDASNNIGSIVGVHRGRIQECFNMVQIVAQKGDNIGGLVGTNYGSIRYAYNTGIITDGNNHVGGLVGYNHASAVIDNCYNMGYCKGSDHVGALFGKNDAPEEQLTKVVFDQQLTRMYATGYGANDPILTDNTKYAIENSDIFRRHTSPFYENPAVKWGDGYHPQLLCFKDHPASWLSTFAIGLDAENRPIERAEGVGAPKEGNEPRKTIWIQTLKNNLGVGQWYSPSPEVILIENPSGDKAQVFRPCGNQEVILTQTYGEFVKQVYTIVKGYEVFDAGVVTGETWACWNDEDVKFKDKNSGGKEASGGKDDEQKNPVLSYQYMIIRDTVIDRANDVYEPLDTVYLTQEAYKDWLLPTDVPGDYAFRRYVKDYKCKTEWTVSKGSKNAAIGRLYLHVREKFDPGELVERPDAIYAVLPQTLTIESLRDASGGGGTFSYTWSMTRNAWDPETETWLAPNPDEDIKNPLYIGGSPVNTPAFEFTFTKPGKYTFKRKVSEQACASNPVECPKPHVVYVYEAIEPGRIDTFERQLCTPFCPDTIHELESVSGGNGIYTYRWLCNGTPVAGNDSLAFLIENMPMENDRTYIFQRQVKDNTGIMDWVTSDGEVNIRIYKEYEAGAIKTIDEQICSETSNIDDIPMDIRESKAASGESGSEFVYCWLLYKGGTDTTLLDTIHHNAATLDTTISLNSYGLSVPVTVFIHRAVQNTVCQTEWKHSANSAMWRFGRSEKKTIPVKVCAKDLPYTCTYEYADGHTGQFVLAKDGQTVEIEDMTAEGCPLTVTLQCQVIALPVVKVEPTISVCETDSVLQVQYTIETGSPDRFDLRFSESAKAVGFKDSIEAVLPASKVIEIALPSGTPVGSHSMTFTFYAAISSSEDCKRSEPQTITFAINLDGFVHRKGNDVVFVDNSGKSQEEELTFTAYQWYKNGEAIEGETGQYYYEYLGLNGYYQVVMTGTDGQIYHSCIYEMRPLQGIEELKNDGLRGEKVLRNGRLLIIVGDKMYNAMGQEERP